MLYCFLFVFFIKFYSERVELIGVIGDRFKEGLVINQLLSILGNVIKVLVDLLMGNKKIVGK